ncbi:hypothetical protein AVEN_136816-1 [Araneus ventricosus]|uniref:Uncharacterized protein n=1 Tax=Araneus ventricosus TaxID=182803 RepID=A0A4Y2NWA4_ARAVE|nr:hypothetical protein AVEN_136816-1 [Araneus ventricosus]
MCYTRSNCDHLYLVSHQNSADCGLLTDECASEIGGSKKGSALRNRPFISCEICAGSRPQQAICATESCKRKSSEITQINFEISVVELTVEGFIHKKCD